MIESELQPAPQAQAVEKAVDQALAGFAQAKSFSRAHATEVLFGSSAGDVEGKSFGDWLLNVRRNDFRALERKYQSYPSEKGLSGTSGTQGGYLVPGEFLERLYSAAAENSVVRPRATIIPMESRQVQIPLLDCQTVPAAGESAFLGGITARWTEENTTVNETEPVFRQIELVAHELSGYSRVSNSLLADSAIGLEELLVNLFGRAIAWHEDYAFLRGDGAGKPLGVLNSGATLALPRSSAGSFTLADAASLFSRLLPGWSPTSTVWAIHPIVAGKLFQMSSGSSSLYLDNAREKPGMVLFGIPVVVTEKLPPLNTPGDVALLDLRHYLIGDRREIEIAYSEHAAFTANQGAWRFVSRVDGQPWLRNSITLSDGATTVSPFLTLAAG